MDIQLREFHDAWALAQKNILKAKTKNKEYYDIKMNNPEIKVGDYAYVTNKVKKHKFDTNYKGPYEVVEIPSEAYLIVERKGKKTTFHKNRTKKARATGNNFTMDDAQLMNAIMKFT